MNLTKEQELLLNDLLQTRPGWTELLEALRDDPEVRPWKPSRQEDRDEQRKHLQWVFESGIRRGFEMAVDILGLGKI